MSNIILKPNESGTGNITIETPNTNTDRTLNIPDTTGNIVTTGDTGSVTNGMISDGAVTSAKLGTDITSRLDDIDKNTITIIDRWYWSTNVSGSGSILNSLRASSLGDYWTQEFTKGSGMTQNHNSLGNGNFGFSENGIYEVSASISDIYNFSDVLSYVFLLLNVSTDNGSSYNAATRMYNVSRTVPAEVGISIKTILHVTDYTQTTFWLGLQASVSHTFAGGPSFTNLQAIKIGEV